MIRSRNSEIVHTPKADCNLEPRLDMVLMDYSGVHVLSVKSVCPSSRYIL